MKKKIVYVPLAVDVLHSGHLNILNRAKNLGNIYIGLLTDNAISKYKNIPLLNYEERFKIINNLKNIYKIIKQDSPNYVDVLYKIKPDYFVHGTDWKFDNRKKYRNKVIEVLNKIGGKLIEVPFTKNIPTTEIQKKIQNVYTTESRVSILKRLIETNKIIRILESHNPLTGLIIENIKLSKSGNIKEFNGMWSSSLTDSTSRGKPDNQAVDLSIRFNGISEILDVTKKPLIFDADNGGRIEHISWTVKTLERLGVSAIMIEDKIGLKKNSLFKKQIGVKQDSIRNFSKKINVASNARRNSDFLIGARIESFILNHGLKDALKRAEAYSEAGADLIMIHSNATNPKEIFSFSRKFYKSNYYKPIVVVPSTYSKTKEIELINNHIKVVIYANHLLRAAYPAMKNVAKKILKNQRAFETEKNISKINEIISLI